MQLNNSNTSIFAGYPGPSRPGRRWQRHLVVVFFLIFLYIGANHGVRMKQKGITDTPNI